MFKTTLSIALLACAFGADAADWQKEFFSSQTNELPPAQGVAVDDQGYVHLQAFNRIPGTQTYFFTHRYTLNAEGEVPWTWGLTSVNRMSSCGVYAKARQRFDCVRRDSFFGEDTRLEMRAHNSSNIVWQNAFPNDVAILDASIPLPNEALILGRTDSEKGSQLAVYRANSNLPAAKLSSIAACPNPSHTLLSLRARMPQHPGERVRIAKACWNSIGTTDMIFEEFDPQSLQWSTLSTWMLPPSAALARLEISPEGRPYALIEQADAPRQLLTIPQGMNLWTPLPFPDSGKIVSFLAGQHGLAVVTMHYSDGSGGSLTGLFMYPEYSIHWFDHGNFSPIIQPFGDFDSLAPKAFALSSDGEVIVLGSPSYVFGGGGVSFMDSALLGSASIDSAVSIYAQPDRIVMARRSRELLPIGEVPLASNESEVGSTYLIGGPNNTALLARTISRNLGTSVPLIGVRVNQYDLPM